MPTVADVLRRYGQQYLEQFGTAMPGEHKKVLRAAYWQGQGRGVS